MAILDKLGMERMNSSGYLIRQEHGPFFKEDFEDEDMGEYELMATFTSLDINYEDDFVEVYFRDMDTYEKVLRATEDDYLVELTPSMMQKVTVV